MNRKINIAVIGPNKSAVALVQALLEHSHSNRLLNLGLHFYTPEKLSKKTLPLVEQFSPQGILVLRDYKAVFHKSSEIDLVLLTSGFKNSSEKNFATLLYESGQSLPVGLVSPKPQEFLDGITRRNPWLAPMQNSNLLFIAPLEIKTNKPYLGVDLGRLRLHCRLKKQKAFFENIKHSAPFHNNQRNVRKKRGSKKEKAV